MMMNNLEYNSIRVSSPSNIAFVKYWGKYGEQLPINPSVSMTLQNCVSIFDIHFKELSDNPIENFQFESKENLKFKKRMNDFLISIKEHLPVLSKYSLSITCSNTFPHSSGIASSASAMSAIVFALLRFDNKDELSSKQLQKASYLARLGSGSACRSLYGGIVHWGASELDNSNDKFASPLNSVDPIFESLLDSVLIIDNKEKKFSSTFGHSLMNNHPYKEARILQANKNTHDLISALRDGDIKSFGRIVENEALSLHGLMMTSDPSVILLHPNSLKAIDSIKAFRTENQIDMYFTIDAGANIHLIYFEKDKNIILRFIRESLSSLCIDNKVIHDQYGNGPKVLSITKANFNVD